VTAVLLKLFLERLIDRDEVRHIGKRVSQLRFGEWPSRPVGKAGRLVDARFGEVVDELFVGDRIAVAADHGGDLRVEQRVRDDAAHIPDDLEVLPRRMEDLDDPLVAHELEERRQVEAGRERVYEHALLRRSHLNEAELRVVGRLAHELRVDGDERALGETRTDVGESLRRGDEFHGGAIAEQGRGFKPARRGPPAAQRPSARPDGCGSVAAR
jgi:hypothetical protein